MQISSLSKSYKALDIVQTSPFEINILLEGEKFFVRNPYLTSHIAGTGDRGVRSVIIKQQTVGCFVKH